MRRARLAVAPLALALLVLAGTFAAPSAGQAPVPDAGPVGEAVDEVAGSTVVPAVQRLYDVLGQNITREDVRITVDLNLTKGDIGVGGLLLGSGNVEVQADVHARVELRVISTDRVRQLLESSGFNITGENTTFLEDLYLPAEVFRASLSAEALAAFQSAEEAYLRDYLAETVPELQVLGLEVEWENTLPTAALTDLSLTEPPIAVELDMTAQYLRVESVPSLIDAYLRSAADPGKEGRDAYIDRLKAENAAPRARRDFLGGAAYDQLLNLSMQPGWSLDLAVHLPRGYEFTYVSDEAHQADTRSVDLHVDARTSDDDVQQVFVASITQPRAVAFGLLAALLAAGSLAAAPGKLLYWRFRLPRLAARMAAAAAAKAPTGGGDAEAMRNLVREGRAGPAPLEHVR